MNHNGIDKYDENRPMYVRFSTKGSQAYREYKLQALQHTSLWALAGLSGGYVISRLLANSPIPPNSLRRTQYLTILASTIILTYSGHQQADKTLKQQARILVQDPTNLLQEP